MTPTSRPYLTLWGHKAATLSLSDFGGPAVKHVLIRPSIHPRIRAFDKSVGHSFYVLLFVHLWRKCILWRLTSHKNAPYSQIRMPTSISTGQKSVLQILAEALCQVSMASLKHSDIKHKQCWSRPSSWCCDSCMWLYSHLAYTAAKKCHICSISSQMASKGIHQCLQGHIAHLCTQPYVSPISEAKFGLLTSSKHQDSMASLHACMLVTTSQSATLHIEKVEADDVPATILEDWTWNYSNVPIITSACGNTKLVCTLPADNLH